MPKLSLTVTVPDSDAAVAADSPLAEVLSASEQAGYDVTAAVEFDPVHMATHEYNFPETVSFARDVQTLSGEEILVGTGLKGEDIHAVVGGAPCQGFSMIGKRALDDPRNQLVNEFARIVLEIQPRYFVLENVAGLATGKHRKFLDEVIELFESNEYQVVTPVRVLQAAEFGVPQSRKRLVLIGARKDVPLPVYPEPTHSARKINGQEVSGTLPLSPSVREALVEIPDADQFPDLLTADVTSATYGEPSLYAAILRGEALVDHFGHIRPHDPSLLTSSMRANHTQKSIDRFKTTPPPERQPSGAISPVGTIWAHALCIGHYLIVTRIIGSAGRYRIQLPVLETLLGSIPSSSTETKFPTPSGVGFLCFSLS
ncbi:hypothetical protein J433_00685 [Corynebacterium glutamicum MT]|nr:hypothetical protein J433_00685 [Corynebacterium glutamicum MT]